MSASLPDGSVLVRFEIRALLGKGGMGEIYKALDPTLQRHVALKILLVHAAGLATAGLP